MTGTMAEKVWRDHIVSKGVNGAPDLLFIDLHLVHEVTSPQAFEGLRRGPQHAHGQHRPAHRGHHEPHSD